MDRRDILDKKYFIARGKYPDESLSDIEVCFGIIAECQDTTQTFAELYRAWILGKNPNNPIDTVARRIDVYN